MKTTIKMKKIIILLLFVSSLSLAQESDSTNTMQNIDTTNVIQKSKITDVTSELEKIYYNLEYNTSSFDDIKNQWVITDPEIIRDLSNKFIAHNYVRINSENVTKGFIDSLNNEVALGNIAISLRKRFFDDEIEYFAFIQNDDDSAGNGVPLFDPVLDGFYLQSIIGKEQYKELQNQGYFYTNVSKEEFSIKHGYNFEVRLDALSSNIMFWSTTSNSQNKYLLSFFGEWGSDVIHFPGWALQQYFIGTQLTYYSKLPPDPRNYSYLFKFGTSLQTRVPYISTVPENPYLVSGTNLYTKLSASIFSKNFFVDMEGMMTLTDYAISDYKFTSPIKYNSLRNFFSFSLRAIKMANLADFGDLEISFGIATHDMNRYEYNQARGGIVDLIPEKEFMDRFNHFINGSIGVVKMGGLVQHKVDIIVGYNPENYGYYGFKINMMLSDTFGFDIRMRNSFGLDNVEYPWRMDSYLVFSPIFKINY